MKNLYPFFQESYDQDKLIEHFWLTNDEIIFIRTFCGEVNRQAVAILLKSLKYLGLFPVGFNEVPKSVKTFFDKLKAVCGKASVENFLKEANQLSNSRFRNLTLKISQ